MKNEITVLMLAIIILPAMAGCTSEGVVDEEPNAQPIAAFSISSTSPALNQNVTFNGTFSADSDGSIASYLWTFGDGPVMNGPTVVKSFNVSGKVTITLTVTDNDGAASSMNRTINVGTTSANAGIGKVLGLKEHGVIRSIQVAPLDYQNFEGVYALSGLEIKVYDKENNPLPGCTVTISGAGTHGTQITDETGTAKFTEEIEVVLPVSVQSGHVLVSVTKSGYGDGSTQIPVTRAETEGIEYASS